MTADTLGPADATQLNEETEATPTEELVALIGTARVAQKAWAAKQPFERTAALQEVKRRALKRAEELSTAVAAETGKPMEEALLAEVLSIADVVDYWTAAIEALLEPTLVELDPLVFPGKRGRVDRVARGVLALITPWNYPVIIPVRHIIPALLCGNAVVWKPSEVTPRVSALIASLFDGVVPDGLLAVVQGGREAGERLLASDVDTVSFTGGVASGKRVAVQCAERLIPCALELGGKDAAIVLADAKVERAARGVAWGAFTNAGQNCASIERVYVEKPIADGFLRRLVELSKGIASRGEVGRITTSSQRAIVLRQLSEAVDAGAEVLCGGAPEGDSFQMAPTVVRVERDDLALMRDETFGPLLAVVVVQNEEEAIARANQSRFGLTASIWTRRIARGERLAKQLNVGVVTINNHAFTAALPMAPWSGTKDTGHGVTNGPHSLEAYTRPFLVLTDRSRSATELWWYPYGATLRKLGLAMARARGGAGFFGRLAAIFALMVLLPRRLFTK